MQRRGRMDALVSFVFPQLRIFCSYRPTMTTTTAWRYRLALPVLACTWSSIVPRPCFDVLPVLARGFQVCYVLLITMASFVCQAPSYFKWKPRRSSDQPREVFSNTLGKASLRYVPLDDQWFPSGTATCGTKALVPGT